MSGTVRRTAWILVVVLALAAVLALVALRADREAGRDPTPPRPASGSVAGQPPEGGSPPPAPPASTPTLRPGAVGQAAPAALDRARDVLAAIEKRDGAPLPGYVGGREFHNRERRLPAGRYREYDVHPRVVGRDRGPERLVIEQNTGRAYYTDNHYRTFVPLN
jgi:guanyl-specific ribonuclease Sa